MVYEIYPCDITSTGECPYVVPHCDVCKGTKDNTINIDSEEE